MKVINKSRGKGKTTELVEYMNEPGNEDVVYIAPTFDQAHNAQLRFSQVSGVHGFDVPRNRFKSVKGLKDLPEGTRIVVDEADGALSALLNSEYGVQVEVQALSAEREQAIEWASFGLSIAPGDSKSDVLALIIEAVQSIISDGEPFWPGLKIDVSGHTHTYITFHLPVLKEK